MPNKQLTLTLVIPAYNEENYLSACLDSITAQSVAPDEVIVVDNNSTDTTAQIARRYDLVRLIREPRQHQSFAQRTGFDAAKSDIIGRIDADTMLPEDWVQNVKRHFAQEPRLAAITGGTLPYDMAARSVSNKVFSAYNYMASLIAGSRMLWGANCAVRRSAWQKVRHDVITRPDIWEDYDLSLCLAPHGDAYKAKDIDVGSSFRAVKKPFFTQVEYQLRVVRTFSLRAGLIRTAALAIVWSTMVPIYLLVRFDEYVLSPILRAARLKKAVPVVSLDAE